MDFKVKVEDVDFKYKLITGENIVIFKDLNFSMKEGEKIGILGISGSGKTTFFKLLQKLISPDKGNISINGNIRQIYQFPRLVPYLTCSEAINLELSLSKSKLLAGDLMKVANMTESINSLILQLSEGQKQKLSLMLTLASNSDIILADEPFSRIDKRTCNDLTDFLLKFANLYKITVLMATHNEENLAGFDKVYLIEKARFIQTNIT